MKRYLSPAVVLRATDFRESDRLVVLFTRKYGKIRAVAKGAKRSRKRGLGTLQIFTHARIEVVEGGKRSPIPRLESADLLHAFYGIARDPVALGYGCYFLELVDGFAQELEPHEAVFDLLVAFLARLDRDKVDERLLRIFELLAADGFGLRPNLESCRICGRHDDGDRPGAFSPDRGGWLCHDCSSGRPDCLPLSSQTRRTMQTILAVDRSRIDTVPTAPAVLEEMKRFLPRFVHGELGRQPKSVRYLVSVLSAKG